MKQIKAFAKDAFDGIFSNEKFKYYDYACFISILEPNNDEQIFDLTIDNFLQVKMWDIGKDIFKDGKLKYEKPSTIELQKIVEFINKHKDKRAFIIHCSAGISRSGAVATYIKNKFNDEVDEDKFNQENKYILPNPYILNKLNELDKIFVK